MRSFTESIECDLPPAPELPAQLDIDRISMRTSDTSETIIEVVKPTSTVDPSLGETQKYKMSVPGPGHSEQEQELHKSLLRDDDDLDSEVEGAMAPVQFQRPNPPSAFARHVQDPEHAALRREYSNSSAQRPRPTTPTQSCALERFAFNPPSDGMFFLELDCFCKFCCFGDEIKLRGWLSEVVEVKEEEKIKVSIPPKERAASRRRKSDMPYSDFYESISSQIPPQSRGNVSGRTTPLNDYEGDILEENPQYKNKACGEIGYQLRLIQLFTGGPALNGRISRSPKPAFMWKVFKYANSKMKRFRFESATPTKVRGDIFYLSGSATSTKGEVARKI
ncbi:hypothetical protein ANCCEY_10531 [Ancylostoma ceylanicum]|uniref:Uncharacterized protein n=1 Tax=Ancylostoma ceylanicum TaxID=53326 RepID=A0A0D6LRX2_9BILA|nr:hypothetical protein ANCCEY_10531 [Ancylostoma ceylanicum]